MTQCILCYCCTPFRGLIEIWPIKSLNLSKNFIMPKCKHQRFSWAFLTLHAPHSVAASLLICWEKPDNNFGFYLFSVSLLINNHLADSTFASPQSWSLIKFSKSWSKCQFMIFENFTSQRYRSPSLIKAAVGNWKGNQESKSIQSFTHTKCQVIKRNSVR